MVPAELAVLVRGAAISALTARGLDADVVPGEIPLERPRDPAHGDYATSIALRTATKLEVSPRTLAGWVADELGGRDGIAAAEVAGPGFLNLRLAADARGALVGEVLSAGAGYGRGDAASVVDEVIGRPSNDVDAARYAMVRGLDVGLLSRRTDDNPLFRVQYVHARLCSLARNAVDLGLTVGTQYGLLEHPREGELIRALGEFPDILRSVAQSREPHRVARYLENLAVAFHHFYDSCRVLPMGDEPINSLHQSRLALCAATRQVLANGLGVLGVSAPERM
nr:DALR anticodon-binding domain-containing protein [Pseudonocardia spinosispora]